MDFPTELSERTIRDAVAHYAESRASGMVKQELYQWLYTQEMGHTTLKTVEKDAEVSCVLTVNGETYTTVFEKEQSHLETKRNVYSDAVLVAICLRTGFPWADESYVAYYYPQSQSTEETVLLEVLQPPREIEYESHALDAPQEFNVEKRLPTVHPNPWSFASVAVPYENTEIASTILPFGEYPELQLQAELTE